MKPSADLILPSVPRISHSFDFHKLDMNSQELECGRALESNLYALHEHSKSLVAAIALFEVSSKNMTIDQHCLFRSWMSLAGRDGAMSLRNFQVALENVRSLAGKHDCFNTKIDLLELKRISKAFKDKFGRVDKLRHSVAHPEHYSNPKKDMSVSGDVNILGRARTVDSMTGQGNFINSTYESTIDGIVVSYDMTKDTALAIVGLFKRVCATFEVPNSPFSN